MERNTKKEYERLVHLSDAERSLHESIELCLNRLTRVENEIENENEKADLLFCCELDELLKLLPMLLLLIVFELVPPTLPLPILDMLLTLFVALVDELGVDVGYLLAII